MHKGKIGPVGKDPFLCEENKVKHVNIGIINVVFVRNSMVLLSTHMGSWFWRIAECKYLDVNDAENAP